MFRWVLVLLMLMGTAGGAAGEVPGVEAILAGLEARYGAAGLEARFAQVSTLQAMDITDTAEGQLWIRRPGQMRWVYTAPEPQTIVTDGEKLWIYRPLDRQVMIGAAPSFFGDGKGAGFLADIGQLRRQFDVSLNPESSETVHRLTLVPRHPQPDLMRVELEITAADDTIEAVTTFNAYGDQTRIVLNDVIFHDHLDDALFRFEIPQGVEIVQMDP
ncbi:MAG: outer membrane lipoprotein carrier protein LolA [Desulfobacterales bacterium]|jgi:outer membrane lipoprotein carrier protein|nr:outer membrane lipoprotein carrier protein LolA [Desulfobacteraceae bacterium]MDD3991070.1 outer membrane lipoprotein carrier protein LolA [Desulfobacteraceae bacterium]MDY0311748.1 outer membrane lipoprotein carrier protein LolA [Desulfobacterales bacterium]